MIGKYFADNIRTMYPDWNVSENFHESDDNVITVYTENGSPSDPSDETSVLEPYYMIWLSSSEWADVERMAYEIQKRFNGEKYFTVTNHDGIQFEVYFVHAQQTVPNRIGIKGGQMQYSVNFKATIKEL